jgi:hypothetical protein
MNQCDDNWPPGPLRWEEPERLGLRNRACRVDFPVKFLLLLRFVFLALFFHVHS